MSRRIKWIALVAALLLAGVAQAGELAPVADAIEAPPERIATLEFMETEVALALGVTPAAMADPDGYRRYVGIRADRLADVADLGTRQEPDLETLIALQPDAVIGSWLRNRAIAERLQASAPTLLYNSLPAPGQTDQYQRMRAIVADMGQRLGRADAATDALDALDTRLAGVADEIAAAGLADTRVVIAQSVPGTHRFRLFTDHSLAAQVARQVGLRNAWTREGNAYGFDTVGLKELARLEPDHLLWITDPADPAIESLRASRLWQALPVVAADRVQLLARDTWVFGGPLSAARLAERYAAALMDNA